MSRCRSGLIDAKRSLSKAGHENPDDEAHRLILCRSYDIKLQKNRRFWGEMYQIYPICLKMSTSDFARILPKSRMRFFVAAWIFTTGGTVLRAYRQSWQTKPQQFPKENFGEGDIFSPAVYYRCTCWRTCPVTRRGGTTNRCIPAINHGFIIILSFISR